MRRSQSGVKAAATHGLFGRVELGQVYCGLRATALGPVGLSNAAKESYMAEPQLSIRSGKAGDLAKG